MPSVCPALSRRYPDLRHMVTRPSTRPARSAPAPVVRIDLPESSAYDSRLPSTTVNIRPVDSIDRERLREILVSVTNFTEQEVQWAMDLVNDAIATQNRGDYVVHVLEDGNSPDRLVQGYVCYGPTPMTEGVFDLYWIAVDPRRQGQGFGQFLLCFVENEVRRQSGRMLLIETRSRQSFAPTLRFYERSGYEEISRIKDFYRIEDDKIIYCKRLGQP
jgi:ribosomal protein S18 acetylase RimI-like enzyme